MESTNKRYQSQHDWYEKNKERIHKQQKAYRDTKKSEISVRNKKYYEQHKEELFEKVKEWRRNNPDYDSNYYQKRRKIATKIGRLEDKLDNVSFFINNWETENVREELIKSALVEIIDKVN